MLIEIICVIFEGVVYNRTLFYKVCDESERLFKIFRHNLVYDPANDALTFHEPDDTFWVQLHKSKDGKFLIIHLHNTTTNEAWFIPSDQPELAPQVIEPRQHKVEYNVEHHNGRFLITTNFDAENFRVMATPVATPERAHWPEVIENPPALCVHDV